MIQAIDLPNKQIHPISCLLSGRWTLILYHEHLLLMPVIKHIIDGRTQSVLPEQLMDLKRNYSFLFVTIEKTPTGTRHGTLAALELFLLHKRPFPGASE